MNPETTVHFTDCQVILKTHCYLLKLLLAPFTHTCNVTPSSRNSLIDISGDIISCPNLSYMRIFQTGSAAFALGCTWFKFSICLRATGKKCKIWIYVNNFKKSHTIWKCMATINYIWSVKDIIK